MKNTIWNIATDLKNSQISRRNFIFQPKTKLIIAFLNILWDEGFILGYKIYASDPNLLKIFLKYKNGKPAMSSLKLISKPSHQIYYSAPQLWKLDTKKSLIVLTTNKGLMTIHECKQTHTGGKPLFIIK
uniref:ribosomal protein S8 n=1 Tax=Skeletonema tropicum TaxID=267982 RepID=UPI001D11433E|nr:ribosomal protein S8 [Skeletonema tropicum]UBA16289.1 ribosomal protein S8 [Skeletonema tropicum]